ncbi:potassium channel AKT1-like [Salvia divinorum]|uniref:Potassium channel n=1 Tax=Salvia divinorum TaxID=28513 RepID=A0ABD1GUG5_SALDI
MDVLDEAWSFLSTADNVCNATLIIDIIINFFVAYVDKSTCLLVDTHWEIATNYATSGLALDVISAIPPGFVWSFLPRLFKEYGLFSLIRLWRLKRVFDVLTRMEKNVRVNYVFARCAKLISVTVFSVNRAACLFYLLAAYNNNPWIAKAMPSGDDYRQLSLGSRYIISLYWSVTMFSTVGFGDLHAVNLKEMLTCIIVMFLNAGVSAYVYGNVTQLLIDDTMKTKHYRETTEAATSFAQRNQLPARLVDPMMSHLSLNFRTNSEGIQQQVILDSLPKAMRTNIWVYLFQSLLEDVYLFRGVSKELLFQLVSEIRVEYFSPNEDVILKNEVSTDFYILATGAVDLFDMKNGVQEMQIVEEAQKGELCGEISVLCNRSQLFTVRTKRLTQLLRLSRTAFLSILDDKANDGEIIMDNLEKDMIQRGRTHLAAAVQANVDKVRPSRITISCPEKATISEEWILLPRSFEELKKIGLGLYGDAFVRVLNEERAQINDILVVRDGDRIIFASQAATAPPRRPATVNFPP